MINLPIKEFILHNNQQFLAANKPAGMASVPDKTGEKSLQDLLEIYCKHTLYPVHRLDRPVSGIILYAKTKKAVAELHRQFAAREVHKIYYALVRNRPDPESGTLTHHLQYDQHKKKTRSADDEAAKEATLDYTLIGQTDAYFALRIEPKTGRQHQIRAQMASIGCPIKGDVKYGDKRGNKDRSIQLHAAELHFKHPISGQEEHLYAPFPDLPIWKALPNNYTPETL